MHEQQACFLGTRTIWIALAVWAAVVLAFALWRSRGAAEQDPIRESGPIL